MVDVLDVGLKYQFEVIEGTFTGLLHCYDPKTGYMTFRNVKETSSNTKYKQWKLLYNFLLDLKLISDPPSDDFFLDYSEKEEIAPRRRDRQTYLELNERPEHLRILEERQKRKLEAAKNRKPVDSSSVVQIVVSDLSEVEKSIPILQKHDSLSFYVLPNEDLSGISLLSIAVEKFFFVYDVEVPEFWELLKPVLEDERILKIFHDCRLFFRFMEPSIVPRNVFDTLLGTIVVLRNSHGRWPDIVGTIKDSLEEFGVSYPRNFSKFHPRLSIPRPIPKMCIDWVRWNVMALFPLATRLGELDLDGYDVVKDVFSYHLRDCQGDLEDKMESNDVLAFLSDNY